MVGAHWMVELISVCFEKNLRKRKGNQSGHN